MIRGKNKSQQPKTRLLQWRGAILLIFICIFGGYALSSCSRGAEEKKETETPTIHSGPEIAQEMAEAMKGADFSTFKHDSPQHNRLPCLVCHEVSIEKPKPSRPGHIPCASCHVQQFEDKSNPMCTICHTKQGSAEVSAFPELKSFNVKFDHAVHQKEALCNTCHESEGKSGMDVPAGEDAHATCFQCHTPKRVVGERNLGSCSTCHEPGTPKRIVDAAVAIGFNFDHGRHARLDCSNCHNTTGNGKMSAPTVAMHSQLAGMSCATCHNGTQAFGAKNFSNCGNCHQQLASIGSFAGVRFDHSDHAKANCATCHKSSAKNMTFSIPAGQNAHNTCFQCHTPTKRGSSMSDSYCFVCHQAGNKERISGPAQMTAANLAHSKHKSMNCNNCHRTKGGDMSAPAFAMHKATRNVLSCASCHNNSRAFGENFTNCKRCHTRDDFKF